MLFRCGNPRCKLDPDGPNGFDFESDRPVCPKCAAKLGDPRTGRFIARMVVVHYEAPDERYEGIGVGHALCDPALTNAVLGRRKEQGSNAPTAVNCEKCLAHADFPKDAPGMEHHVPAWKMGEDLPKSKDELPGGVGRTALAVKREDKPRVALGTPQRG